MKLINLAKIRFPLLCLTALMACTTTMIGQTIYEPDCNDPDAHDFACAEPTRAIVQDLQNKGYPYYIGHAEPAAEFFDTTGTSGYNMQWKLRLPATDPQPTQNGSSVANFELFITYWLGLALCDPNSLPFGNCIPDSDAQPSEFPGAAFLELQFFPPGINCSNGSRWCVLLHINTLETNSTDQILNCFEPTTAAWLTTNGQPSGTQLAMNTGDELLITLRDTANGLRAEVDDLTTSSTGSMVASGANGFVHNANQTDCTTAPFDFHPLYATASPGNTVQWLTLQANVSLAFEVGHWELCTDSACTAAPDAEDAFAVNIRGIGGYLGSDLDHDGTSYQADWPDGVSSHPASLVLQSPNDRGVGPLTSPAGNGNLCVYNQGYSTIRFATTEPVFGAFYPFYSQAGTGSSCVFNFGKDIPGATTDDFNKAGQYGTTISNPCLPVGQSIQRPSGDGCLAQR
jgi:plastocyanin